TLINCNVSILLYFFILTQKSRTLFVQTGKDVLLEIMDPDAVKDYILLAWRVKKKESKTELLVSFSSDKKPTVHGRYTKTAFPQTNFSVILKNLQKADSGLYDAQMTTSEQVILVTYNITVLDPVSPVKLTVEPVSSSPDSCNVTVSCTTDDYTISSTLTCTNQTCTNQGDKSEITPSAAHLHIYLSDDSITCNHSNQVNWTTATAPINLLCPTNPGKAELFMSMDHKVKHNVLRTFNPPRPNTVYDSVESYCPVIYIRLSVCKTYYLHI
uniref:Immunoglobulin V-set domain-containing protein n=1 Tax=Sphaeramia orbicularis TaxID=375764 RepID=A0A673ACR0_9TELE